MNAANASLGTLIAIEDFKHGAFPASKEPLVTERSNIHGISLRNHTAITVKHVLEEFPLFFPPEKRTMIV